MISRQNRSTSRENQKRRTREDLVEAAVRLIERGEAPRIAAVAAEAGVSRATAYRYFPSEEALLLEAPLTQRFATAEEVLEGAPEEDVAARVARVQEYLYDHARENEAGFRRFLQAVYEQVLEAGVDAPAPAPRAGRRNDMLELALAPRRDDLDDDTWERLRTALALLVGIDSLIVVKDVCGLPPERGREILNWAARTLVSAVLEDTPPRTRARRPRRVLRA